MAAVFRGVGLMLSMVPINNLALGTMPPQKIKNASGLFNLMRNLGGAVGLALINTLLDKRMDLHLERLRESVTWGRQVATDTLASMTAALAARGSDAELAATRQLALIVRKQAEVMALSDVFLTLTVVFLGCVGLAAMMRRPVAAGGGGGGHNKTPANRWLQLPKVILPPHSLERLAEGTPPPYYAGRALNREFWVSAAHLL